jgi:hypothetical protein
MKNKNYLDKVTENLEVPYLKNLELHYGVITPQQQKYVLGNIFKLDIKNIKKKNESILFNDKEIYMEFPDGVWGKKEYDSNGRIIYFEKSNGYWKKWEYNEKDNLIFIRYSDGKWEKRERDENGRCVYYEDENGWDNIVYHSEGYKQSHEHFENEGEFYIKLNFNKKGKPISSETRRGGILQYII